MSTPLEQSLSELTLCLFERPVHPELFNIYASRRFFQGDYETIIWVTGCSHVVSVFMNGACMTELICSPDQLLPRRGLAEKLAFRGEKTHERDWSAGLGYMVNFQVENMSGNLYRKAISDLKKMGKRRGMLVNYPQWGSGDLAPLSYVDYEARVEELYVHTFHALPEQRTILKTQSLFQLRKRP